MNKTWKAVLGIFVIFLFGCFSGAVCTSIFFHNRMAAFLQHPAVTLSAALEKRLTGNLDLDANQRQQVHEYFMENLQQRKVVQKEIQPQIQMLNRQTFQQVSAILHPDQAARFQQNIELFRKRAKAMAAGQDAENMSSPGAPVTNPPVSPQPGQ
jgi:hypothetical protein